MAVIFDTSKRDALAVAHLDLVGRIARSIQSRLPPSFDTADLVGVGWIALLAAADRYAPERFPGVPFAAFARRIVRGAMLESVRRRHWRANTMCGLEVFDGNQMRLGDGGTNWAAPRYIEAPEPSIAATAPGEIDERRQRARIAAAAARLPFPQRHIVREHYGPHETPFAEIAATMGLSMARIYQLHARAIGELRIRLTRNEPSARRLVTVPSTSKPVTILKVRPTAIAEAQSMFAARQRAEVDELGALEKEFAPLRPKLARIELLRKSVRARYDDSPATGTYEAQGERFIVAVGARANESVINYPKLIKGIGVKLFCAGAKTTLKWLEENVSCSVRAEVITLEAVGTRSLKTFEKGDAPELPKAA